MKADILTAEHAVGRALAEVIDATAATPRQLRKVRSQLRRVEWQLTVLKRELRRPSCPS